VNANLARNDSECELTLFLYYYYSSLQRMH